MPDTSWKKAERRAAKALGGRRVPFSGGLGPESSLPKGDVMGTRFAVVEVKHCKAWAAQRWIRELEQRSRLQPWLLVLSTPKVAGQYALLRLGDLAALVREAESAG